MGTARNAVPFDTGRTGKFLVVDEDHGADVGSTLYDDDGCIVWQVGPVRSFTRQTKGTMNPGEIVVVDWANRTAVDVFQAATANTFLPYSFLCVASRRPLIYDGKRACLCKSKMAKARSTRKIGIAYPCQRQISQTGPFIFGPSKP